MVTHGPYIVTNAASSLPVTSARGLTYLYGVP